MDTKRTTGKVMAGAAGSLIAFANPPGRYPAVTAGTIAARAWTRTGQAIRHAEKQFDAGRSTKRS